MNSLFDFLTASADLQRKLSQPISVPTEARDEATAGRVQAVRGIEVLVGFPATLDKLNHLVISARKPDERKTLDDAANYLESMWLLLHEIAGLEPPQCEKKAPSTG